MGDMSEGFRAMTRQRQARHHEWNKRNRAIIDASGIPYIDRGETLLFREPDKSNVDFYPSTGRWKANSQMHSGGAKKFLEWYAQR